jgi:hypothetical protein
LWGGAGGGGGAGGYSSSFYNEGGNGGTGGYVWQELDVNSGETYTVVVGSGGVSGSNATVYSSYLGNNDSDGTSGGDTWFGDYKAAGGEGGTRGSALPFSTVGGNPGSDNIGDITATGLVSGSNVLGPLTGLNVIQRSYLNNVNFSSMPGIGGTGFPPSTPSSGEGGSVVITVVD